MPLQLLGIWCKHPYDWPIGIECEKLFTHPDCIFHAEQPCHGFWLFHLPYLLSCPRCLCLLSCVYCPVDRGACWPKHSLLPWAIPSFAVISMPVWPLTRPKYFKFWDLAKTLQFMNQFSSMFISWIISVLLTFFIYLFECKITKQINKNCLRPCCTKYLYFKLSHV